MSAENERRALLARLDRRPLAWLGLGALLLVLTEIRAPFGLLAWLAPIPWLRYLRVTTGARSRLAFAATLVGAWTAAIAKMASAPAFLALAPLFAAPIALAQGVGYVAWSWTRRRRSPAIASFAFAAALGAGEWTLTHTPFGSWGAAAYTQLDDGPLLQAASVVGLVGVGVIVHFTAASMEAALHDREGRRPLVGALALTLGVHAFGVARTTLGDVRQAPTVLVAAIATDSDVAGPPLPSRDVTHAWDEALFARTRVAARGGAVLAVWPEAGALVWPDEENAWVAKVQELARENDIDVVASYVLPTSLEPFAYRNELRIVHRDGTIEPVYAKHHPVPGERTPAGVGPAPRVERAWGTLSAAICYDYDYPEMARARADADIVALPASDWRGIDPVHAQMAAVRAIESGHSVLRSTRAGLSVGVDPHGRIRAWQSAFEPSSGVLFVTLPRHHVATLYATWGDAPLAVALGALLLALAIPRSARLPSGAPRVTA